MRTKQTHLGLCIVCRAMLTSADELARVLDDKRTLVIDTRSFSEYAKGHIPGAVSLDVFSFHWVDTSEDGIRAFTNHARVILSMIGADASRRIVVYDDTSGMLAARGVWLLHYMGHPDTTMLDGGLGAWGRDTETEPRLPVPSTLDTVPNRALVAGYQEVLDGNADIIDSRTPDEYAGKLVRAARGGHIPHATNINWSDALDADGKFLPRDQLARVYDMKRKGQIITYCQGAYRAAHAYVALGILGYDNVAVYLGSWGEWGNKPELPAE